MFIFLKMIQIYSRPVLEVRNVKLKCQLDCSLLEASGKTVSLYRQFFFVFFFYEEKKKVAVA